MIDLTVGRIAVPHDDPIVGAVGVIGQRDLCRHGDRRRSGRPPGAVDGIGEDETSLRLGDQEDRVGVRDERLPAVAHARDECASRPDLEPVDARNGRRGGPPLLELRRLMLAGEVPRVPIYLDSPMALRALKVYRAALDSGSPQLRSDLDEAGAALLFLSAANWAYTWLQPGRDTEDLADRFFRLLIDGMRGYSTPA